jgi:argininosuccinate lyase
VGGAHPTRLGAGVKDVLGVANAVKAFRSYGSTAREEVEKQLKRWKERLKVHS